MAKIGVAIVSQIELRDEIENLPAREASPVPDGDIVAPTLPWSGPIAETGHNLRLGKKETWCW